MVDELNSLVGIAANLDQTWPELHKELVQIQHFLFDCENDISNPDENKKINIE